MGENRSMTTQELKDYDGAVGGFVMDSDEAEARLFVCSPLPDGNGDWYLYGDITAAFGIDSMFEPVDGDESVFGNHAVQRIIEQSDVDCEGIEFDPEGMCFFAYAKTFERVAKLAEDINALSKARRGDGSAAINQIGTVEILATRIVPLDGMALERGTEVIVEPGVYPLHDDGFSRYWMLSGQINDGSLRRRGDGLFTAGGGDRPSGIWVTFPSRMFGPDDFKALLEEPSTTEGHVEQRLRITVTEEE